MKNVFLPFLLFLITLSTQAQNIQFKPNRYFLNEARIEHLMEDHQLNEKLIFFLQKEASSFKQRADTCQDSVHRKQLYEVSQGYQTIIHHQIATMNQDIERERKLLEKQQAFLRNSLPSKTKKKED